MNELSSRLTWKSWTRWPVVSAHSSTTSGTNQLNMWFGRGLSAWRNGIFFVFDIIFCFISERNKPNSRSELVQKMTRKSCSSCGRYGRLRYGCRLIPSAFVAYMKKLCARSIRTGRAHMPVSLKNRACFRSSRSFSTIFFNYDRISQELAGQFRADSASRVLIFCLRRETAQLLTKYLNEQGIEVMGRVRNIHEIIRCTNYPKIGCICEKSFAIPKNGENPCMFRNHKTHVS